MIETSLASSKLRPVMTSQTERSKAIGRNMKIVNVEDGEIRGRHSRYDREVWGYAHVYVKAEKGATK